MQVRILADRGVRRALARADTLADQGRWEEAVRFLTAENRRLRDRRLERRVLELRFEAADHATQPPEPPPWPDTVPDLFPGAVIPEVRRDRLTTDVLRSAIVNHGTLLVRGLLDQRQSSRLSEDIDRTFASFDATRDGGQAPADLAGWFERCERDTRGDRPGKRDRGAVQAVDSPPALFDLIEVLDDARLRPLLSDYFGEPPFLLARKVTLRRVERTANTGGWHQDGAFMGPRIRSLNVWIALTRCGDEAPGIDVVGRRLDHIVTSEGSFAAWGVNHEDAVAVADGTIVRPVFDPGDALLFDQLCLHRTAVDPDMGNDRHAIEAWFLGPSTYGAMVETVEEGYQPRDQLPFLY